MGRTACPEIVGSSAEGGLGSQPPPPYRGPGVPTPSHLPVSPCCSPTSRHTGLFAVVQTHMHIHTPGPLYLLFPLPGRLFPSPPNGWLLCFTQASAQMSLLRGLPDMTLQALCRPIPVLPSFWFLLLPEMDLLLNRTSLTSLPTRKEASEPLDIVHLGRCFVPGLEQGPAWSEHPSRMNISGGPCMTEVVD